MFEIFDFAFDFLLNNACFNFDYCRAGGLQAGSYKSLALAMLRMCADLLLGPPPPLVPLPCQLLASPSPSISIFCANPPELFDFHLWDEAPGNEIKMCCGYSCIRI